MTIHSGTPPPDNDDDNAMQLASVPARENFPLHHWLHACSKRFYDKI